MMKSLQHPNIIKFFEAKSNQNAVGIYMELADDGTIAGKIKERARYHNRDDVEYFSERQIMYWFV